MVYFGTVKVDQLDPLRRRVLPYLHRIGMLYTFSRVRFLMTAMQVLNTKGAARRLGCSQTWIHKLVSAGKLRAYTYGDNGVLVERTPEDKRQGQGLYFFASDVDTYQPEVQRRPRGSKNKKVPVPSSSTQSA
jgi:excisionase family DNA binding protein